MTKAEYILIQEQLKRKATKKKDDDVKTSEPASDVILGDRERDNGQDIMS